MTETTVDVGSNLLTLAAAVQRFNLDLPAARAFLQGLRDRGIEVAGECGRVLADIPADATPREIRNHLLARASMIAAIDLTNHEQEAD